LGASDKYSLDDARPFQHSGFSPKANSQGECATETDGMPRASRSLADAAVRRSTLCVIRVASRFFAFSLFHPPESYPSNVASSVISAFSAFDTGQFAFAPAASS
jgi:hypothetical protein